MRGQGLAVEPHAGDRLSFDRDRVRLGSRDDPHHCSDDLSRLRALARECVSACTAMSPVEGCRRSPGMRS